MRPGCKKFHMTVSFLISVILNEPMDSGKIAFEQDLSKQSAKQFIREIKKMIDDLNLPYIIWYDVSNHKYTYYYVKSKEEILPLTYKNLNKYFPFIVLIKLLLNQQVNCKALSSDGFKCEKRRLNYAIDSINNDFAVYTDDKIVKYSKAFDSYIIQKCSEEDYE